MSLERYCEAKRVIIQDPRATAYEAARALENNHVGAVIVQESGSVVGIVTDRALALRVIGMQLDPRSTPVRDVMTPGPATLTPNDSEQQAVTLMRARHVRRIPIVEDGHAVGIVTLDDLILSRAVDVDTAAEIIEAQLVEPSGAKPAGVTHPTRAESGELTPAREARSASRAAQTLHDFTARLLAALSMTDAERALTAFEVLAQGLVQRLTPAEAADFVAQLPSGMRDRLLELPAGPERAVTLEVISAEMARRLELDRGEAASLVRKVASVLPLFVSAGELEDVVSQLPLELKALFKPPPA